MPDPNPAEALREILLKPVRTGSRDRYDDVLAYFLTLRVAMPFRAQALQRKLRQPKDPLRLLMGRRLRRAKVPELIDQLGKYPDERQARGTTDGRPEWSDRPVSPASGPAPPSDPWRGVAPITVSGRSQTDWSRSHASHHRGSNRFRYDWVNDTAVDSTEGPLRLSSTRKEVTQTYLINWAYELARKGNDFAAIRRSLMGSHLFEGDRNAGMAVITREKDALDALARDYNARLQKALRDSAPEGARYVPQEEYERILGQEKYRGSLELQGVGGFGTSGRVRVGDTVNGREIFQIDPEGSGGGTIYFRMGMRAYAQSKLYFQSDSSAVNVVVPVVYEKTKGLPMAIMEAERLAGKGLSWLPGKAGVVGMALEEHGEMGLQEFREAEQGRADAAGGGGPVPPDPGRLVRGPAIGPKRKKKRRYGSGAGRPYIEGEELLDIHGNITPNGIAYLRGRFPKKLANLSDEAVGREFRRSGSLLEAAVKEEVRVAWLAQTTATQFVLLRDKQTLRSVIKRIWRAGPKSKRNPGVLNENVSDYIAARPDLRRRMLELQNHANPAVRRVWHEFAWGQRGGGRGKRGFLMGKVGRKEPDVLEVFLDRNTARLTDITGTVGTNLGPVHEFKTEFYRSVIAETTGLRVEAQDFRSLLRFRTP